VSYTLITIDKTGYLHFRVCGKNTSANVRGYLAEIYSICAERQRSTILIEEDFSGPSLDIGAIFGIASAGSAATAPIVQLIAYVDVNPEHSPSKMQFAETVAITRGINIRVFGSVSAAEEWLRDRVGGELSG
jgi:hypothetical protein